MPGLPTDDTLSAKYPGTGFVMTMEPAAHTQPQGSVPCRQEAEALQRAGKYEEALKKYRQGLQLGPDRVMEDRAKKLEKYIALTKNRKPFTPPVKPAPHRVDASGPPEKAFDNGNIYGVGSGPTAPRCSPSPPLASCP